MIEESLISEFGDSLRADAAERLSELPSGIPLARDAALAEVMLGYLEEAGAVTDHDLCPHKDEGTNRPCRIVGFSLPEDSTRLELFTSYALRQGEGPHLPRKEVARLSGWAARFFDYAAKGSHARFADNEAALEAAVRIQTELPRIEEVRVHVLTDALVRDRSVDVIQILGRDVETEIWDLERLYRAAGEEVSRDRIEVDFTELMGRPLACLEMKPPPDDYQTFLTVIPGDVVFKLYDRFGPRLFEFNVRSFLQAKGAVNKGIRKTIEEAPGRFLAYNNGLTATADDIDVGTSHGETVIRSLRGLQIVNGAQTTASIHRARKVDKLPLEKLAVSMKLTLVPPDKLQEFVPLIARFANTQNPIQVADLSASDAFHQKFESLSESVWCPGEEQRWFYERARGAYQVARNRFGTTPAKRRDFDRKTPKSQSFGKADLAKYLMTWWGEPHTVSKGAQKNYSAFMFGLRGRMGEDWEPDREFFQSCVSKALIFKAAQAVVKQAKLKSYGANVVTYLVAKLAADPGTRIDFDYIWDAQRVSDAMRALFSAWAPVIHSELVESAGKRNVTEWCKKEGCWDVVRNLDLAIPSPEPDEFYEIQPDDSHVASSDIAATDPVLLCLKLDGAAWGRVIAWVAETPGIEEIDRKVAHTLSGYAMDGWRKPPSLRQAVRGARVIAAATRAGVNWVPAAVS